MSYFIGKSHFDEDGTQNYLVFQLIHKYFKFVNINNEWYITSWKSKRLSEESIKPPVTSDSSLNPLINYYYNNKIRAKFTGSYLKQYNLHYKHKNVVSIYIVYGLGASTSNNNDPTLKNCLFGAVTLIKNADIDKYGYFGYGIGLDQIFHFQVVGLVKTY